VDIKKTVAESLSRPMNRREFLARGGATVLTLIGVTAIIKSLEHQPTRGTSAKKGYGSSTYGE